jgi:hypothetical protein
MLYPHVTSSFESEVVSPKVEEMFSQEIESLRSLRINPKLSSRNYMRNADYNQSQWVNFVRQKQITKLLYYYLFKIPSTLLCTLTVLILTHAGCVSLQMTALKGNSYFPK